MNDPGTTAAPAGTPVSATESTDVESAGLYGLLAEFETPARATNHGRAVVVAIRDIGRCPRGPRQRVAHHQPFVRIDRGRGDGAQPSGVIQQSGHEAIAHLRQTEPFVVALVCKDVHALRVGERQVHPEGPSHLENPRRPDPGLLDEA